MTPPPKVYMKLPRNIVLLLGALLLMGCASGKPTAVATADRPVAFWPPYPDEPRVQFLRSFSTSNDVAPTKSGMDDLIYGKEKQEVLPLNKPYGVGMHDGKIYVCDLRNAGVTILDLRNKKTLVVGKTGNETMRRPTDIAIADDGMKYVSDNGRGLVFVLDAKDRPVALIGHPDMKPTGVAVHGDELYVCDFAGSCVEVFNRFSGQSLRKIGKKGTGEGEFIRPLSVAVDSKGDIYVMDALKPSNQFQKFSADGKLISTFGTLSASTGGLVRPKQIAVDADGTIYVVDAAFQNVQMFDQQGRVLTFFGSPGDHPGAMYMPVGITVHEGDLDLFKDYIHPAFQAERLIVVTNQFGDAKVSVYALGRLKPGMTVKDISASAGLVPLGVSDPKHPQNRSGPTTGSTTLPADAPEPATAPTTLPGDAAGPTTASPPTRAGGPSGTATLSGDGALPTVPSTNFPDSTVAPTVLPTTPEAK